MANVVVYVRADDVRMLEAKGVEPAKWVRELVAYALRREREKVSA